MFPPVLPEVLGSGFILPERTLTEGLLFYDLETTGLSGGAGNTAFLIGLGSQKKGAYTLTQLFLADYPGEAALLERFSKLTEPYTYHLSYNGLSFDSQVLKTRFLLNRLPPPPSVQFDLLYPARRLWRGLLPDLGLKTVEAAVLNFLRTDDLPGSEAPEAWFRWLAGWPDRIGGVFRHNADDILSLARLLARMEEWGGISPLEIGLRPPGTAPRCRGMACQWDRNDGERAYQWLEAGWRGGEVDCGLELAYRLKRRGDFSKAVPIWEEVNKICRGEPHAAAELAKYWEHRRRDPKRALESIEGLESQDLTDKQRDSIEYRRARLLRKADKWAILDLNQ